MKRVAICFLGLCATIATVSSVAAEPASYRSGAGLSPYMRVFGPSQPPYGFVRFCEANPDECAGHRSDEARFQPTPERLSELDEINRSVNRAITPATDAEIYGISEYWTLPVDKGDCEDYALLKRKLLMARGWPMSALLLTVVRDEKGEGHAVLTARTAEGDFILDNKVDGVRLWSQSGYHFVMRQSFIDPHVWVSLDTDAMAPPAIAGVRNGR
jgi:predicted transglutaminase-like cysteine proteinase